MLLLDLGHIASFGYATCASSSWSSHLLADLCIINRKARPSMEE